MGAPKLDYATIVRHSERASWTVDGVMPPGTKLDFGRPFLPKKLAPMELDLLSPREQLKANQIAGNAYLNLFLFVEEYIIATTVEYAQAEMFGDHHAVRALLRFAEEELKHQQLFRRYREAFERDFGCACRVIESPARIAATVMAKSAMAVLLLTLHLEIMTQAHYVECVKDDNDLDPFFVSLLKNHWVEESQHSKIDRLELDKLLAVSTPEVRSRGVTQYLEMIGELDLLLGEQAEMNVESLALASGREFSNEASEQVRAAYLRGLRQTFIHYGARHPSFSEVLSTIADDAIERVEKHLERLT